MTESNQTARPIGRSLKHFNQLDSTNSRAKQLLANNEPVDGTVILADYQSAGRGQLDNIWLSAPGQNLLMSIILRPNLGVKKQFYLNKALTAAIADFLIAEFNLPAKIKWPNDILIQDEKIVGLLIENQLQNSLLTASIIGVGFNINQVVFPLFRPKATSLAIQTGQQFTVKRILEKLVNTMNDYYSLLIWEEYQKIDDWYHQHLYRVQEAQRFELHGQQRLGIINGVDEFGQLCIQFPEGEQRFQNKQITYLI